MNQLVFPSNSVQQRWLQKFPSSCVNIQSFQDPAIMSMDESYLPYTRGRDADAYIRWPEGYDHPDIPRFNGSTLLRGYVWPNGETVFPDFMKASAEEWWINEIVEYHDEIPFDGLWIVRKYL